MGKLETKKKKLKKLKNLKSGTPSSGGSSTTEQPRSTQSSSNFPSLPPQKQNPARTQGQHPEQDDSATDVEAIIQAELKEANKSVDSDEEVATDMVASESCDK